VAAPTNQQTAPTTSVVAVPRVRAPQRLSPSQVSDCPRHVLGRAGRWRRRWKRDYAPCRRSAERVRLLRGPRHCGQVILVDVGVPAAVGDAADDDALTSDAPSHFRKSCLEQQQEEEQRAAHATPHQCLVVCGKTRPTKSRQWGAPEVFLADIVAAAAAAATIPVLEPSHQHLDQQSTSVHSSPPALFGADTRIKQPGGWVWCGVCAVLCQLPTRHGCDNENQSNIAHALLSDDTHTMVYWHEDAVVVSRLLDFYYQLQ
jgi:hypothetical protein